MTKTLSIFRRNRGTTSETYHVRNVSLKLYRIAIKHVESHIAKILDDKAKELVEKVTPTSGKEYTRHLTVFDRADMTEELKQSEEDRLKPFSESALH